MSKGTESNHKQLTILRCKLVIIGDACVGKTALTQVFQSGGSTYPKNYMMTIGSEYTVKQLPLQDSNSVVEFHMYDCAGASIFNQVEMNAKYYENAAAVAIVYDIGNRESLLSCKKWFTAIKAGAGTSSKIFGVLIGNKVDYRINDGSDDLRAEVQYDDGARMADELGLKYFETSAANNSYIDEPFRSIAVEFNKRYNDTLDMVGSHH